MQQFSHNSYSSLLSFHFSRAKDLAVYLQKVTTDKQLFMKHTAYRYLPKEELSPTFLNNFIDRKENEEFCSLARRLGDLEETQKLVHQRKEPDLPCIQLYDLLNLWPQQFLSTLLNYLLREFFG